MSGGFGSGPFGGGSGFGPIGDVTPDDSTAASLVPTAPSQPTNPVDLLLDDDGDLYVDAGGIYFSSGLRAVTQGIRLRMQTFKGEWFLDLDHGVPYWQDILGQKYNETKIRAAFRKAIEDTPGVTRVLELEVDFDNATRQLSVSWKAQTTFGVTEDEIVREV